MANNILILFVVFITILCVWYYWYASNNTSRGKFKGNNINGYASLSDEYDSPYILKQILSVPQCRHLILYSQNKLINSNTADKLNTNVMNIMQTWIPKSHQLVRELYNNISIIVGIPINNAEDMQIVRYKPGQYFNQNHDECNHDYTYHKFTTNGGQRVLTVLIYLNNDFSGGTTKFHNLDIEIKPDIGCAVIFHPTAKYSTQSHPLAQHGGEPVTEGEKWIANIWFRENEFKSSL